MRSFFYSLLIALNVIGAQVYSQTPQTDGSDAGFVKAGTIFSPLLASVTEARVGVLKKTSDSWLRLDVGTSADLYMFSLGKEFDEKMTIGTDFFTWSSLMHMGDFHFAVDAVDYLFGVNMNYSRILSERFDLSGRLRISHISAHLVDGRYDKTSGAWRDGQLPRVYSREFVDLLGAVSYWDIIRVYAGMQYVFHVTPKNTGRFNLQGGIEAAITDVGFEWMHAYIAYDLRLTKISSYSGTHSGQLGLKLGKWYGRGLNLYLAVFHGYSQHGEYFDMKWSYWGPGFAIDF